MAHDQDCIGAIDQGTTGTRFMVFDRDGAPLASAYREHRQHYPQAGWVEHDPAELWTCTLEVMGAAVRDAALDPRRIAAIGVTNQRETVVLWDAATGRPACRAIVWQDRRTADRCAELVRQGHAEDIRDRTGLPVDPYFSATKVEWLLQNEPRLADLAKAGTLRVGTVDSWLLWNLTGQHVTDATNACRTLLFNLRSLDWDPDLLDLFGIPQALLPEVRPSVDRYGVLDVGRHPALREAWGADAAGLEIPVAGCLGDQQAALFGQTGFDPGDTKVTAGTGSFLLRHTGTAPVPSRHGLIGTVACAYPGRPAQYALEGSVFVTGAAVQWLRDGLRIITSAHETQALAESVPDTGGVYLVPAFAGLGAPYWDPYARGTLVGMTGGTSRAHVARAALEAIAYQTRDVFEAMAADDPVPCQALRIDGGAARNDFLCRFQADVLGVPVVRPAIEETTSLGAAFAAGLAVGLWPHTDHLRRLWRAGRTFDPCLDANARDSLYRGWRRAVRAAQAWAREREP